MFAKRNNNYFCDQPQLVRVGVKYFSKYLSQVQVLFHIYKYKYKYSEYLEDIKYIKYFFNQVQVHQVLFQSSTSQVQVLW